jgi:four helix bundle protein
MSKDQLKKRTKEFSLRVIRVVESLPIKGPGQVIGHQLLRSGTSVGANYRSACRAKSQADFINKIHICEEEADESLFWMELLVESGLVAAEKLNDLMLETNELVAIFSSSAKTARANNSSKNKLFENTQSKFDTTK